MKLYYREFLLFAGETNISLRERLGMEKDDKPEEKNYEEGAALLRAFILSKMDFSRVYYLDDENLVTKLHSINKAKTDQEFLYFPLSISNQRKAFLLENQDKYRDIILPSSENAWRRIKSIGERGRWGMAQLEEKDIFDTDELFLDKEDFTSLLEISYLSSLA